MFKRCLISLENGNLNTTVEILDIQVYLYIRCSYFKIQLKLINTSNTKAALTGTLPAFHSENPVKSAAAVGKVHMKRKCQVSRGTQLLLKLIYTSLGTCANEPPLKISRLRCLSMACLSIYLSSYGIDKYFSNFKSGSYVDRHSGRLLSEENRGNSTRLELKILHA